MATIYDFENRTAFNPETGEGTPNAVGQVFAKTDTTFSTPLVVTLMGSGLSVTDLTTDQYCQLQGFQVTDLVQVVFKSGDFTKVLNTTTPLVGPEGPMGLSAFETAVQAGFTGTEQEFLDSLARSSRAFPVPAVATITEIRAVMAQAEAAGGGTVQFAPGAHYDVNGTIRVPSRVTVDGNGATLKATANAAFTVIDLGDEYAVPQFTKPVLSIVGTAATRHQGVTIRNLKIDGNGSYQPTTGVFSNIVVGHANDTTLENVTSVDSGLLVTPMGGTDEGICLLVEHSDNTMVIGGRYDGAGYDAIRIAGGSTNTKLVGGTSGKGKRSAVQVTPLSRYTSMIGWTFDNRGMASNTAYGFLAHNAHDVTIQGGAMYTDSNSPCVQIFGDGNTLRNIETKNVRISGVEMSATGSIAVQIEMRWVRSVAVTDCTFQLYGSTGWGGVMVRGTAGTRAPASVVTFDRCHMVSERTAADAHWSIKDCEGVFVRDCTVRAPGFPKSMFNLNNVANVRISGNDVEQATTDVDAISVYMIAASDVTVARNKFRASRAVRIKNDSANIDVLDNDLTGIAGATKMGLYGPSSGVVRGNKGAPTEANGVATVPAAATSVTVTHALWPGTDNAVDYNRRLWSVRDFQVSFAGNPGAARAVWVSNVTPTQVTFTVDAAPGADAQIAWSAAMNRAA